ncbi:MAG: UDP-N-acetylmuramoyl-L-alanyl-D-glutamate--2,6-diaminopimelate ligase [Planctomycetes bacterium]|nr:UDP-N-acetylmuramoyl-L-alanyl-D-glutamate--2,6-diaminopimelate ligase [Planctomycetota bacterium]
MKTNEAKLTKQQDSGRLTRPSVSNEGIPLGDLLPKVGVSEAHGVDGSRVLDLVTDSRRVVPGSLFFAMEGLRVDGNDYVEEAIKRGAVGVVSRRSYPAGDGFSSIRVDDARQALARFSRRFHCFPDRDLALAGVTGTNGKTTVSTLVKFLLERENSPVGMIGTVRYDLGDKALPSFKTTPESADLYSMLRKMQVAGCAEAVMEVSSHGIAQDRVNGLNLAVAAFLNLSRDHLDYHGSMEEYFRAKCRIFNGMNGSLPMIGVINADCQWGRRLLEEVPPQVRLVTFGESMDADFRAREIQLGQNGSHFLLECSEGIFPVFSPLLGRYNISNALAAFAIALAMGQPVKESVEIIRCFHGVDGRMQEVDEGQPYKVLVDYAHTPDALGNALQMLREFTPGRLQVVFGCGGDRDRGKRSRMTEIACGMADLAWATADNPRTEKQDRIFRDMRKGISDSSKIEFVSDRRRAISKALDEAGSGDCVLIAGKGHETLQEINRSALPFDDRLVARELLQNKREKWWNS